MVDGITVIIAALGAKYYLDSKTNTTHQCPTGYHWDATVNACVQDAATHNCPTGYHWDDAVQACVQDTHTCPTGFHWDAAANACVQDVITPPPPGGAGKDQFGITMLNQSIGNEWFSKWQNRAPANLVSGMTDSLDTNWKIAGNGVFEILGDGTARMSGLATGYFRALLNFTHQNVEITHYERWISDNTAGVESYAGWEIQARTTPDHTGNNITDPATGLPTFCRAVSYGANIMYRQAVKAEKEVGHPFYGLLKELGVTWDKTKWIGGKLVLRNMADGSVHLEVYMDKTEGVNGGTWTKILDVIDNGTVAVDPNSQTICHYPANYVITIPNSTVIFRNDGATNLIKWASVREIAPEGTVTPPLPPAAPTPGSITLSANPTSVTAGNQAVLFTVQMKDMNGTPRAGWKADVYFDGVRSGFVFDSATQSAVLTDSTGTIQFTKSFPATTVVTVKPNINDFPNAQSVVSNPITITFGTAPPPPPPPPTNIVGSVSLTANPTSMSGNVNQLITLTATIKDTAGNPMAGKSLDIYYNGVRKGQVFNSTTASAYVSDANGVITWARSWSGLGLTGPTTLTVAVQGTNPLIVSNGVTVSL